MSDAISSASELVVRYSHHTVLDGATLAINKVIALASWDETAVANQHS